MMKNLLILSNIEWNFLKQRHQHLALGLKDKYNVIFVESLVKRNPGFRDISRIFRRIFSTQKKSYAEIKIITPVILPSTFKVYRILNRLYFSRRLTKKIKSAMIGGSTVLWNYLPSQTVIDLIDFIHPEAIVYDCVSNFAALDDMPRDTSKLEQEIVHKSNMVVVDCDFLYEKHRQSARRIELIGPGVDFIKFNMPYDAVKGIRNLGYFGVVDKRLNLEILHALKKAGYNIDLIGPVRLDRKLLTGINLIPEVPHADLPRALQKYDGYLLPYVHNELTKGVIPAKTFECFATGKPVIISGLINLKKYSAIAIFEDSADKLIQRLKGRIDTESLSKQRLEVAQKHDWKKVTGRIHDILVDLI